MVFLNLMLLLAGIFFRLRKVAFFNYLFAQFWSNFVLGSLDCDHNNAFFCDVRDSSFYSFVICPILFELTIMLEVSRFIFSFLSSGTQRSSPFGRVSKGNFIITSTSWYSFGYNITTRTVIFIAQLCLLKALVESYYHLCTISFPLLIRQHT